MLCNYIMNITNSTSDFIFNSNLDPKCFGGYYTIILAVLLFISEAMPFITSNKAKPYIEQAEQAGQAEQAEQTQQTNIMSSSNGLAHILMAVYKKTKK